MEVVRWFCGGRTVVLWWCGGLVLCARECVLTFLGSGIPRVYLGTERKTHD